MWCDVHRDEYYSRSTTLPPSLFAHNAQTQAAHNLDSTNMAAKGVLGRIIETLDEQVLRSPDRGARLGREGTMEVESKGCLEDKTMLEEL